MSDTRGRGPRGVHIGACDLAICRADWHPVTQPSTGWGGAGLCHDEAVTAWPLSRHDRAPEGGFWPRKAPLLLWWDCTAPLGLGRLTPKGMGDASIE